MGCTTSRTSIKCSFRRSFLLIKPFKDRLVLNKVRFGEERDHWDAILLTADKMQLLEIILTDKTR
jgi:hypothetical protein